MEKEPKQNNQLILFKIRDLRQKTQYKIDDAYLNGYARVCKPIATAVYNSLCRHAEFNTQKAFPSQGLIAYQHNVSVKTVSRAIKKLVELNIISIERDRKEGKFERYIYTLLDKSEWKSIIFKNNTSGQKRPMVEPVDKNTSRQTTVVVQSPTKDNKEPNDNKLNHKDTKNSNQVALIRNYFIEKCKKLKGFEPEMSFGKEGKLLKEKLKRYSVEQLKSLINEFMESKIGKDLGFTLSICLSAGVINQWQGGVLKKPKKPTYNGHPMRKMYNKWQVLEGGDWKEFADAEAKIVYF